MKNIQFERFLSEAQIQTRIAELGAQITKDYSSIVSTGNELFIVPILKGSFMFAADLVRQIKVPLQIDFIEVSSYGAGTESSGQLTWHKRLRGDVKARHVLVVEDIVDTGVTMNGVTAEFKNAEASSVKLCTLLHKPSRERIPVEISYKGFTIEDKFVVGYGLDFDEKFREHRDISIAHMS